MTDLTAQQMIERILQSLEETGRRFQRKKRHARPTRGAKPKSAREKSNSARPCAKKRRKARQMRRDTYGLAV
jgi:hypothetical protein